MSTDAPGRVPDGREDRRPQSVLEEERDFFLRSLRDLDAEHAAGDIDDVDYAALRDDYTARAAAVLRQLRGDPPQGGDAAPPVQGGEADEVAASPEAASSGPAGAAVAGAGTAGRRRGSLRRVLAGRRILVVAGAAVVLAAVLAWALVSATGTRMPGQTVSGQALGAEGVGQLLTRANQAAAKGDAVTAVKDYQKVIDQDPTQTEALTGEGWLLAETQQPALLRQGLQLLQRAEQADPTYGPAHVYRGIALLSEGDDADAIPELQYYLAHDPAPQLEAKVADALRQAQAAVAAQHAHAMTPSTGAGPGG